MHFPETINGRLKAGSSVSVTLNGVKMPATYVRPINGKRNHRCRIAYKDDAGRARFATISTRKVAPTY